MLSFKFSRMLAVTALASTIDALQKVGQGKMNMNVYQHSLQTLMDAVVFEERVVWVQTQAPAGNWVDNMGLRHDGTVEGETIAISKAQQSAAFLELHGDKTRIVRKTIEVLS